MKPKKFLVNQDGELVWVVISPNKSIKYMWGKTSTEVDMSIRQMCNEEKDIHNNRNRWSL